MEQLLKITTVPIIVEYKVNNARLEMQSSTTELEISRDKRGLTIRSRPVKLDIDTFEARNSVVPTTKRSIEQVAEGSKRAAYEATARIAGEGKIMLSVQIGENAIDQLVAQRMDYSNQFGLGFLPTEPPEITFTPGDLTIQYEMDKLNFDWKLNKGDLTFIPGNIEFTLKQMPDVIIEYIGGPIYVPPSSDPSYVPIDMRI